MFKVNNKDTRTTPGIVIDASWVIAKLLSISSKFDPRYKFINYIFINIVQFY